MFDLNNDSFCTDNIGNYPNLNIEHMSQTTQQPAIMDEVCLMDWPLIPEPILDKIVTERAHRHRAIPFMELSENQIAVAIDDAENLENLEQLSDIFSPVVAVFYTTTPEDMDHALNKRFSEKYLGSGA